MPYFGHDLLSILAYSVLALLNTYFVPYFQRSVSNKTRMLNVLLFIAQYAWEQPQKALLYFNNSELMSITMYIEINLYDLYNLVHWLYQ